MSDAAKKSDEAGSKADTPSPTPPPKPADHAPCSPERHRTIVRTSLVVLATAAVAVLIAQLGRVLEPLVFAIFLYFLIDPAAAWLTRYRVPRWVSYTVLLVAVTAVFFLIAQTATSSFAELTQPRVLEDYERKSVELAERVMKGYGPTVRTWSHAAVVELGREAPGHLAGITEFGLMMLFYLIFIIINAPRLPERIRKAYPARAPKVLEATRTISERLQRYMFVKTVVSLGLAATAAAALALLRVEYWPLWAILFFLLNYITYLGSIVACVPPIAIAVLQHDLFWAAVVAAAVTAIRLFWIDFIEIKYSGHELNIDSVLLLLALAVGGWYWGAAGLVLAVPMLTALKVIFERIDGTRPWAVMMSER